MSSPKKPSPPTIPEHHDEDEEEASLESFGESSNSFDEDDKQNGDKQNGDKQNGDKQNGKNSSSKQTPIYTPLSEEHQNTPLEKTKELPPIPLLCLKSGILSKASPLHLSSWVNLSLTLDGRDKITKTIQYSSRFLVFYTQQEKFLKLQKSLTQSRKAYRLGRSITELYKLYSLGLLEALLLRKIQGKMPAKMPAPQRQLLRRASSNIGFGIPPPLPTRDRWFKRMYSNIVSSFYDPYFPPTSRVSREEGGDPVWRVICASLKLLGLCGFWFGDNCSYLTSVGFLEDPTKLKKWQHFAARSYFFGAVVGLYANLREIVLHRGKLRQERDRLFGDGEGDERQWEKVKVKHFKYVLALLKSCCDVLVFSNNPGIDLHLKYRGRKMHEGFHCLCGFLSASTVLYNNFPDAPLSSPSSKQA